MKKFTVAAGMAAALMLGTSAFATDLEVTHWWTSGGEAAAVAEFAKAFDATGNKWIDGGIAGSADVARPIILSRIQGGQPMDASMLNTGRDAEELIRAGLMTDLTELSNAEGWDNIINSRAFASCKVDGKVYCVPVNIHSTLWLWVNRKVFEDNGLAVPTNWNELVAAAPALREKGILPLSLAGGFAVGMAMDNIAVGVAGLDEYLKVYRDKDEAAAAGPAWTAVFKSLDELRNLIEPAEMMPTHEWAQAVAQVINGQAAANIMGDWAQGEFAVAGKVAGVDYDCFPGLGVNPVVNISGDSFFFPVVADEGKKAAQLELAKTLVSPDVQVAFNLKKGSMPIRQDIDLSAANDCMKKGLALLADEATVMPSNDQLITQDIQTQIQDLQNEFFADRSLTVEDAQARFAEIIASAD
jgi:glucose/mannose transport system substrate-binding protein